MGCKNLIPIIIICSIVLLLIVLYFFMILGRTKKNRMEKFKKWSYAHRGLHGNGLPENSMAAFRAALDAGYGIELDIHLLKDGNLAVIHDSPLVRTTGAPGRIEDLTTEDLKNYHLEGTAETIPTFREVIELFAGKAPMIVELKPEGGNHGALADAACAMLDEYSIDYCMESFDPRAVAWLKKHHPDVVRGQLTEDFLRNPKSKLPWILKLLLSKNLMNFLGRPDFVAYKFADRKTTWSLFFCRKQMESVAWTLTSQDQHDAALREGWIPIFEGYRPPAKQ